MTGLCVRERSGPGAQRWPDGSQYDGPSGNGLKHGSGTFTWTSGESYKGSFYKDYRHGRGTYSWPDGSRFTGKFYLNRKEGYGVHAFPDGTTFKGLYHADERFGPGVMSYPDGRQDVGLWYRQWLLRLCTSVEGGLTLTDFPEHMARLRQKHLFPQIQSQVFALPSLTTGHCMENQRFCSVETSLLDDSSLLEVERFILPPGIESYSTDSDHLPIPRLLRQELDLHFFNRSDISTPSFSNGLPIQQRMEAHIHTHRFELEELDWDVATVLAMNRERFGPKGPLELRSERLIREASLGDPQNVQQILRDGKVHPDVADASGHTALIAATASCHDDVIHLLLDSGADVNKLNDMGMSALAVCSVLYYPLQSLHETVAERTSQNPPTIPEIGAHSALTNSPQESAAGERPEDEGDTEPSVTDSQTNQMEQGPSPEECSTPQDPEVSEHSEEIKTPTDDDKVPQVVHGGQGKAVEAELLEEAELVDGRIPVVTSTWRQGDDEVPQVVHGGQGNTVEAELLEEAELVDGRIPVDTSTWFQCDDEVHQVVHGGQGNTVEAELLEEAELVDGRIPVDTSTWFQGDDEVPQVVHGGQGNTVEAELLEEAELVDGRIPVDTSTWFQGDDEGEGAFFTEKEENGWRNGSPVKNPGFDLTSSVASFHIDVTEDIMQQMAEVLCETGHVSPAKTQETEKKPEHQVHWATMKLLLERGADPNVSVILMPVIFLAIKAGHVEAVQRLLECSARTDLHLPAEQKGLYPLHVAAGLPGPEGPKITELLLHAVADPDVKAQDASEVYDLDKNSVEEQVDCGNRSSLGSEPPTSIEAPEKGGRTPLHVACQRDTDYTNARDVVSILLSHQARTNHLWSGHSPLSLAIASGNDLAVDELLAAGADPNLPLSRRVGSALCAATNIHYNCGSHPRNRVRLVEKLIKAGANILMPVVVGEGSKSAVGTAVDYAHYMFNKDWRVAHIPYHALNQREREAYNARRQLLTMMGELLRRAAISIEKQRLEHEQSHGIHSISPTDKFVFTGTGATPPTPRTRVRLAEEEDRASANESLAQQSSQNKGEAKTLIVRKPLFKYCYQCGRSAWVALTPCSRCREVFYCSKTCKLKAWNERHKEECVRVPGWKDNLTLKQKLPSRLPAGQ